VTLELYFGDLETSQCRIMPVQFRLPPLGTCSIIGESAAEHPLVPTRDDLAFFVCLTLPGGTARCYAANLNSYV